MEITISKTVSLAMEMVRACLRTMSVPELKDGLWMQMNIEREIIRDSDHLSKLIGLLILVYPGYRIQASCSISGTGEYWDSNVDIYFPGCKLTAVYERGFYFDCQLRNGIIEVKPR